MNESGNGREADDAIRVEHISKRFGAVRALEDVSMHLKPGEVLGLIGDNGAGKSTLVKIISGFQKPDSGTIFVDGEEVSIPSERVCATERSCTSSPLTKIVPLSGFWKPQMILISVDLPAPLSPISPRTSLRFRCMDTSSSARTAPKRFEMCSTRITSTASRPLPASLTCPSRASRGS